MNDLQKFAEDARKFAQMFSGLLVLANRADLVGGLEQSENEGKSRLRILAEQEDAAKARLAALQEDSANRVRSADEAIAAAEVCAEQMATAAASRADEVLAEARSRAAAILSGANDEASAIQRATDEARKHLANVNAEITSQQDILASVNSELDRVRRRFG